MLLPKARISMPMKIALECPSFRPMLGASREKRAKVSKLRVVKNPAAVLEIPKSSRMKGISGPTEAMEVRKLMEIKITPKKRRTLEEDLDKGKS
jgi:hypothetical protein